MLPGRERSARFFSLLILAWLASAVVHVVVLLLLSLITLAGRAEGTGQQEVRTLVDEGPDTKANLIDDELGLNPGVLLNYNINRIEDIAVPGPTLPADPVGLKDAPLGLPVNIPPPPGLGDNSGQGGGLDLVKPEATANPVGIAGGMSGINVPGGFGGRSGATKEKLLLEGGGNSASEAAVAAGQKWLVQHQAADGHWSLNAFDQHQGGRCNCTGFGQDNDIAGTALGLLPLLGRRRNPSQFAFDLPQQRGKGAAISGKETGPQRLFRRQHLWSCLGRDRRVRSLWADSRPRRVAALPNEPFNTFAMPKAKTAVGATNRAKAAIPRSPGGW